ncbi:MAG TPA: metal-dependent transcriptional regulator [Phycisphaerales bacterium]|nr:metal-dependent transcriptional regulator [Phycisphaerales bacterium]HMP37636.1 metal-dependent transcriptional regulator [Phycisphaerales bacterium]
MPSSAVEDYLKAIHRLQHESPGGRAGLGDVARALGVTKGTVTTMSKRLAADRLARYERYGGLTLTPRGEAAALAVMRRHRIVETFLVDVLGLDWAEVHEEAERLEHALSDAVLDRLDAFLGRPRLDPHGDPIPDAAGSMERSALRPLAACEPGMSARLVRVLDQEAAFLNFAATHGFRPGARLHVRTRDAVAESMGVAIGTGEPITLALAAALKFMVAVDPAEARAGREPQARSRRRVRGDAPPAPRGAGRQR